jgi:HJR/Mrr/RecB family endonuclease
MNNDKILLEQLIEYEIKEYDAKILNEQLLKNIGNAIKSFFQKIASFLGGIGKSVKAGHDIFIKDWSETQKKCQNFLKLSQKIQKSKILMIY